MCLVVMQQSRGLVVRTEFLIMNISSRSMLLLYFTRTDKSLMIDHRSAFSKVKSLSLNILSRNGKIKN